ncbi:MAG: AAA family ATPase [Verrucomicrobia bacterium]|nr:AAA family ATPase [Verrucomicrobiota bacterium]
MTISPTKIEEILTLVRQKYPEWSGFADPRFEQDEVAYKQATIAKAKTLLSREELERLIAEERFDEFIKRLEQIGRNNNLLYQSVPLSGDLSVLYQPNLDKPAFCRAIVDLLYGDGPVHERLTRYADFVKANNLPNKWTFPTYFLFICHPVSEMFVKPRTTKWFLEFAGADMAFPSVPTPFGYVTIKQCAQLLKDGLQQFGPRDMVDIQGLIWVCFHMAKKDSAEDEEDAKQPTVVRETPSAEERFFTEETFALLAGLHANPTQKFYMANRNKFREHVEEPFQRLFRQVRDRLPAAIREAMETEKNIFARIPKNDYGRGGAWDFYWGAFYTKGGKRIKDAQLAMWMNHERFQASFYIGNYGSECRTRFDTNFEKYRDELVSLLEHKLTGLGMAFGYPDDVEPPMDHQVTSFAEWAKHELGYSIRKHFPKETVITMSAKELIQQVTDTFAAVFPLVLLAMSDDPMPAIRAYLNQPATNVPPQCIQPEYTLAQCAEDTGMAEAELARWVRAIERKEHAILYGPPGTGKTFVAEKLARHLIGGGDGFSDLVQFHPSYAYEDFMQGIRPKRVEGGLDYPTMPGRFLDFCQRAAQCSGRCVLIIDEINRANLARVFGELMYLLEYRQQEIPLAGGGRRFRIPGNVRLLGTMNTADRSIALVDYALRRRFAFLPLYPNFDVLRRYHQNTGVAVDGLVRILHRVNQAIDDPHYHVGISFFLRENLRGELADIWQMEIEPYLEEYFFDQRAKYEQFRWQNIQGEIGW